MNSAFRGSAVSTSRRDVRPPSMIERVTMIMDLFDRPHALLLLEDVTDRTGLPRSSAHRILDQLVNQGWLEHMTVGYRLGYRALTLGGRETTYGALRSAAAPVLHELALHTGLVVHLAVLEGVDVYYLDKIGGREAVTVPSQVGGLAPAHCTALGKAMLSWLAPEQVDERYADVLPSHTAHTISSRTHLHRELGHVRSRHGMAFERGECVGGIGCVGVALHGPDGPVGALSLVADAGAALERLTPLALGAARRITDALDGIPGPARFEARTVPSRIPVSDGVRMYQGRNRTAGPVPTG